MSLKSFLDKPHWVMYCYVYVACKYNQRTHDFLSVYLLCHIKIILYLFCRWERTDKQQPFTYRVTSDYTHHRLHTGAIGSVVLYCHELFKTREIKKIKSYASVGIRTCNPWVWATEHLIGCAKKTAENVLICFAVFVFPCLFSRFTIFEWICGGLR